MSASKPRFAAIWDENEADRKKYHVVATELIRNFDPNHEKDFDYTQMLRYKRSKTVRSTSVYVLALGDSHKAVVEKFSQGQVRYPTKMISNSQKRPLSTEEEEDLKALRLKKKKHDVRSKFMSDILKTSSQRAESLVKPLELSSAHKASATNIPVSIQKNNDLVKSPAGTLSSSGMSAEVWKRVQYEVQREVQRQHACHLENQLKGPLKKLAEATRILEEDRKAFEEDKKKFHEAINRLRTEWKVVSKCSDNMEVIHKDVGETLSNFERRLEGLEKRSVPPVPQADSDTDTEEQHDKDAFVLPPPKKVNIGEGIRANYDMWSAAVAADNKESWASYALQAVFGPNAKYYRVRKPRIKDDANLKVFPTNPPVLSVLKGHFRAWLEANPAIVDQRPCLKRKKKDHDDIAEEAAEKAWILKLKNESATVKTIRRASTQVKLVRSLGSLLGDKATDMYRAGTRGRSKKPSNSDSISDKKYKNKEDLRSPRRKTHRLDSSSDLESLSSNHNLINQSSGTEVLNEEEANNIKAVLTLNSSSSSNNPVEVERCDDNAAKRLRSRDVATTSSVQKLKTFRRIKSISHSHTTSSRHITSPSSSPPHVPSPPNTTRPTISSRSTPVRNSSPLGCPKYTSSPTKRQSPILYEGNDWISCGSIHRGPEVFAPGSEIFVPPSPQRDAYTEQLDDSRKSRDTSATKYDFRL